jgi:membrane dipeptidase
MAKGATRYRSIEAAHQAALNVLKPSKKDLQHGLALHKEIVVVETYGFAPYCAPNPKTINRMMDEGASDAELDTAIEEMRVTRCVYDRRERDEFQAAWRASGITGLFQNAGGGPGVPVTMAHYCHVVDSMPDFLVRATTPREVIAVKKAGKQAILFSSNSIPLTGDGSSVQGELRLLRTFFDLGFREMHLAYNRANPLGDGCVEPRDGGLTDLGRAAMTAMNEAGIIIDVAHTGWRSSYEAAKASRLPIIASHTACCGLFEHYRGKPDNVIKAIAEKDGLIGVVWVPAFLGRSQDLNAMLDHVDYLAKLVGVDRIGIGTDVVHVSPRREAAFAKMKPRRPKGRKSRSPLWSFWPPKENTDLPTWRMARKDSLAWVNRPYATVGLVQRGYSDADIAKIMGLNHLRVMQAVLDGRKLLA